MQLAFQDRLVDLTRIAEEQLAVEDLSWCLARICRYGGRLPRRGPIAFYSVADHSVLVALILREWGADALVQFHGLMHDAHEAIIGDITTPVKRWLGVEALEMEMARAVAANFGLWRDPEINAAVVSLVKTADSVALAVEVAALGLPMHLYFPDERQRDRYLAMAPDLRHVVQREGLLVPNLTMFVGDQIEQSAKRFERWFADLEQKAHPTIPIVANPADHHSVASRLERAA